MDTLFLESLLALLILMALVVTADILFLNDRFKKILAAITRFSDILEQLKR